MTVSSPRQLILGHRGSPREVTENTLASLARAIQSGADGVELDVQRSRDGVPVVIHDNALDRTTKARGVISGLDWAAIARLTNAEVPSFHEAAAWAAASGAWLNVELKAAGVEEAVVRILDEMDLSVRTIISSFNPDIVRQVREFNRDIPRFLLTETWDPGAEERLEQADAVGIALRRDAATDAALGDLSRRSLPVVVWTVNTPEEVRHFLDMGVAAIISDYPEMAARERDRLSATPMTDSVAE